MRFIVFILLFMAACVPKPEEIKGCGSGMEFNETVKSCVALASITMDSNLTALAVTEDAPQSFTLPSGSTDSVEGTLFWFITKVPTHGDLSGCADLNGSGVPTSHGTVLRSCVYTPDADFIGTDYFAYRVCRSIDERNCTAVQTVTVTVSDDNADAPTLGGPSLINVIEGSSINFDVRVERKTEDESNSFYLCVDLTDPDTGLDTPAVSNTNVPADPIGIGDANCSLLGTESDDLGAVLATFSSDTFLLPSSVSKTAYITMRLCEASSLPTGCTVGGIDGVDNDADTEIDEEDEWNAADLANVSVVRTRINVNDKNFSPVMATGTPPLTPKVLASETEDLNPLISIGTGVGNDHLLEPRATDMDGEAITYELVPASMYPLHAGTLLCVTGAELACTFAPAANFSGSMSFRYRAVDASGNLSQEVTVSLPFIADDDAPVFLASQVYDYATPINQVALVENTVLASRTFKVGEGGGITENVQTLTLTATSSDPTVLATSGIRVHRGPTNLGVLSSPIILDSTALDADAQNYTLTFTPVTNKVSATPVTITLTLSDGNSTTNHVFDFTGVENKNDPIVASISNPGLGMQLGSTGKDLVLRAHPGTNDWQAVTGGSQSLTVTVASSSPTVADASATNLSTLTGTGITITQDPGCTSASCLYTIVYDGTDDPSDDDLLLNFVPGVRGTSTITLTFSDGVSANRVLTTSVNVYNFTVTFNGWNYIVAGGTRKFAAGGTDVPAGAIVGWDSLTVTEGGVQTTAYTVRVYRKNISDFTAYPANAIRNAGVAATANIHAMGEGVTYDDGSTITSGERFYVALAVVPNALGEPIYPPSVADRVLEVVIPPDNMVLAHRWTANRGYCSATGQVADRANHYRCRNQGLGGVLDTGVWYHDAQVHTFVDAYEAGCPYSPGMIEDTRLIAADASNIAQVHYERSTGACTYSDGTSWLPFASAAFLADPALSVNRGNLPPLVGLTRTEAQAVCEGEAPTCAGAACPAGTWAGIDRELPTRREMIRVAGWPNFTSPLTAAIVEDSGNHTTGVQACNTNSGSGLTYTTLASLGSLTADTLPATSASTIRSVLNSALASRNCLSNLGVYNAVGNVAEWLADSYSCLETGATHAACEMLSPVGTPAGGSRDASLAANNALGVTYNFDGSTRNGPLLEKDTILTIGSFYTFDVDRHNAVEGLPFLQDGGVPHPSLGLIRIGTQAPPYGASSGIFSSDTRQLNWNGDTAGASTQYALVSGGDWTSTSGAGRYTLSLQQDAEVSERVGQRCVMRLTPVP